MPISFGEEIPFAVLVGATSIIPFTIPTEGYLTHLEVDCSNQAARLALRLHFGNMTFELSEGGGPASAELTWDGCIPVKSGMIIDCVVRADGDANCTFKILMCDEPVPNAGFSQSVRRSFDLAMADLVAVLETATGAGATSVDIPHENHILTECHRPIQVRQVTGGAADVRVYLHSWDDLAAAYVDILLHTEAGVANNTWTTIEPALAQLPQPFYQSDRLWYIVQVTALALGDTISVRLPVRRTVN